MRVKFLGPPSPTLDFLRENEDVVETNYDLIVSHGYREVISPRVLATVRAVNLHISYLPWNRGAHPNYWAAREGTPSGVTIHWMDEGIDTGPIIARLKVPFEPGDTLRTSYDRLQAKVTELFIFWWEGIKEGVPGRPQDEGTYHRASELPEVDWDTPVSEIQGVRV